MDWFSLSLLCAFSLAAADAFSKKYLIDYSGWALVLVRFVVPGIILLPMLLLTSIPVVPLQFWGWIAFLIPLEMLAMLFYVLAIRDAPLYQTLPYLAFTPVFNILTGWLILGEQVSLLGSMGICLVVIGTYLLNIEQLNKNGKRIWFEPFRAILIQQGSRRMLLAAMIYSVTSVGGKAAMQYVGPMSFGALYFVILAITTLFVVGIIRPRELKILTSNFRGHLLVGIFMAAMIITHFWALSLIETAYMIAVKRTSLLFGILFGYFMFKEHGLTRNFSSASLMVMGVALILIAK